MLPSMASQAKNQSTQQRISSFLTIVELNVKQGHWRKPKTKMQITFHHVNMSIREAKEANLVAAMYKRSMTKEPIIWNPETNMWKLVKGQYANN